MDQATCSVCGAPTGGGSCERCSSGTVVHVCARCAVQMVHFQPDAAPAGALCWPCECEDRLAGLPVEDVRVVDEHLVAGEMDAAREVLRGMLGCTREQAEEAAGVRYWELRRRGLG